MTFKTLLIIIKCIIIGTVVFIIGMEWGIAIVDAVKEIRKQKHKEALEQGFPHDTG